MDILKIMAELRQERDQLDMAIISLQRLAASGPRRRGRPPGWLKAAAETPTKKRRGRPPGSKNKPK
jgi:hypothetical protein